MFPDISHFHKWIYIIAYSFAWKCFYIMLLYDLQMSPVFRFHFHTFALHYKYNWFSHSFWFDSVVLLNTFYSRVQSEIRNACLLAVVEWGCICLNGLPFDFLSLHFKMDTSNVRIRTSAKSQRIRNRAKTLSLQDLCSYASGNMLLMQWQITAS